MQNLGLLMTEIKPTTPTTVWSNATESVILCRCEQVTVARIRQAVHGGGATTVNQVKKLTRAGMGLCQGKTCARLLENLLAEMGHPCTEPFKVRPPVRPIPIGELAATASWFPEPRGPVEVVMLRRPRPKPTPGR